MRKFGVLIALTFLFNLTAHANDLINKKFSKKLMELTYCSKLANVSDACRPVHLDEDLDSERERDLKSEMQKCNAKKDESERKACAQEVMAEHVGEDLPIAQTEIELKSKTIPSKKDGSALDEKSFKVYKKHGKR